MLAALERGVVTGSQSPRPSSHHNIACRLLPAIQSLNRLKNIDSFMLCSPDVADARTEAIAGREDAVSCLFRTSFKFLKAGGLPKRRRADRGQ